VAHINLETPDGKMRMIVQLINNVDGYINNWQVIERSNISSGEKDNLVQELAELWLQRVEAARNGQNPYKVKDEALEERINGLRYAAV